MLEALRRQLERIGEDRDRIRDLYREKQDFFNNATHEPENPADHHFRLRGAHWEERRPGSGAAAEREPAIRGGEPPACTP